MNLPSQFKLRSLISIALVAVLSIATGMVWRGNAGIDVGNAPATPEVDYRLAVETVTVGSIQTPQSYSRFSGIIQACRESQLGFRRGGRVAEMIASEGDEIMSGTMIGRLDTADLLADRMRLEAELRSAAAQLRELENGPRPETVEAASSEVMRLKAVVNGAQLRYQRQISLNRNDAGTEQELDDSQFMLDQANAELESATQRHRELLKGTRQEQLDAATANVAVIQSQISRLDVDLQDCLILAPYDGTVSNRLIDEGTIASAGQTAFEFIDTTSLEVRFGLPATWTSELAVGQTLQVELDGDHAEVSVSAEILRLHPQVDPVTRNRNIDVQLASDCDAVIGQVATLRLHQREADDEGFWVPTSALAKGSRGLWSLYALTNEELVNVEPSDQSQASEMPEVLRVERRDIQIERTDGLLTRVSGMIRRGDRIVSDGVHRVSPGILVVAEAQHDLDTAK